MYRCLDTCKERDYIMNTRNQTRKITISALLTAIAIMIPIVMPIRVVIGPASFTLASHVPIFMAMFLSPSIALIVALGATAGFFVAGFPIVIVLRALSHIIFAYIGAVILKNRRNEILGSFHKSQVYSFVIGLIHALGETAIVSLFFFGGLGIDTSQGFLYTVFLLVGVGTLVHSMVDFIIAQYLWKPLESRMTDLISS